MTYLTKQNIKEATDEHTAVLMMEFLNRSTVSQVNKEIYVKTKRKGKDVDSRTVSRHYPVESVIEYCNENKHLSQAAACLSVCATVQRGVV